MLRAGVASATLGTPAPFHRCLATCVAAGVVLSMVLIQCVPPAPRAPSSSVMRRETRPEIDAPVATKHLEHGGVVMRRERRAEVLAPPGATPEQSGRAMR